MEVKVREVSKADRYSYCDLPSLAAGPVKSGLWALCAQNSCVAAIVLVRNLGLPPQNLQGVSLRQLMLQPYSGQRSRDLLAIMSMSSKQVKVMQEVTTFTTYLPPSRLSRQHDLSAVMIELANPHTTRPLQF